MLNDVDLKELHNKAAALPNSKIEQALQFATAEQVRMDIAQERDTEHIDAWIMALRMEQARRAGKLRMMSDQDGTTLARLWMQLSDYRSKLRELGLDVELKINEIEHSHVKVSMVISGPVGVVSNAIEQSAMG